MLFAEASLITEITIPNNIVAKKQSTNKSGKSQDYEDIFDYTSLQKQDNRPPEAPLLLFIERIFDHRIFLCIILGVVSVIALLQMPATDGY